MKLNKKGWWNPTSDFQWTMSTRLSLGYPLNPWEWYIALHLIWYLWFSYRWIYQPPGILCFRIIPSPETNIEVDRHNFISCYSGEPRKKKLYYFPLYWLFNRDPYNNGLLLSPFNYPLYILNNWVFFIAQMMKVSGESSLGKPVFGPTLHYQSYPPRKIQHTPRAHPKQWP